MDLRPKVLIVEDDCLIADDLRESCRESGALVVDVMHRAGQFLERVAETRPDYIFMNLVVGDEECGADLAKSAIRTKPDVTVVFVTAALPEYLSRLMDYAPYKVLTKPFIQDHVTAFFAKIPPGFGDAGEGASAT